MSNYVKSTNFATKDSLSAGDVNKIVKGTEIDTEFNNIATAVSTKADTAAPTFTGTTTLATATITTANITTANITNDLAVADGGTGASTASGARSNLSAASSGSNSDITSLSGLTTPLSVAQGGTGTASTTYCNLTTNVTGTLPVANGGTGAASLTANNVLLGNGTSAVQVVAPGTSGNVLTSNGTTWVSQAAGWTLATPLATTSGTTKDFTGLPANIAEIVVMLYRVSTNDVSNFLIQLGDSGGFETSGYISEANGDGLTASSTAGFILSSVIEGGKNYSGQTRILRFSGNKWVGIGTLSAASPIFNSGGSKELSDQLTQIRLTTVAGNTFDSGEVNILYRVA